jgi:cytochrome P450
MTTTGVSPADVEARTPPGPSALPVVGIVPEIIRQGGLLRTLVHLWRTYGDVYQSRLGTTTAVFFARPTALQRILVDNRDNYPRARRQIEPLNQILGDGLVTSEGAHWRRQRHLMQGPLAARAVPAYAPAMLEATRALLNRWDERTRARSAVVVLFDDMAALILDILGRTIFGFDTASDVREVGAAFVELMDYFDRHLYGIIPFFSWIPTADNRRMKRNVRFLDDTIERMTAARRAAPDTYGFDADLLSVMLRARDDWGEGMLERHLRDEVLTLYLAGHETTAELLCWVFYALDENPAVEDEVHAELDRVLGERDPSLADIQRLPYTCMVVDETLRLYPPGPMLFKDARTDDVVDGYRVPAGALVVMSEFITHRHPDLWPDADRFEPRRHADAAERHRLAMLPFSAGNHSCIGAAFALQEARLVIATVAHRYRLRRVPGPSVDPMATSTLRPKGLRMRLEPRRPT